MKKTACVVAMMLFATIAAGQEVSLAPGISFSGSPSYILEFPTQFRDNGGPLSPFGSHFGVKAEVRKPGFAGMHHYACATGTSVLDYSRTGLVGTSRVEFRRDGRDVPAAKSRKIHFEYFGWTEDAAFDGFSARAQVQFLGLDNYLLAVQVKNESGAALALAPELYFERNGKRMAVDSSSKPSEVLLKCSVQPTVNLGDSFLSILPSAGAGVGAGDQSGDCSLTHEELKLSPGESRWFWFIFAYSPDSEEQAMACARRARDAFSGPEASWQRMLADREKFFASLPAPHLAAGDTLSLDLYRMSATALENALYAPRGDMTCWACVPTKVHYNWFWLWDSGFQTLGYSEYNPAVAREVVQSIFAMQEKGGFIAHMEDERQKGITPHSQPPVFGFSLPRIMERYPEDVQMQSFRSAVYDQSRLFIKWWDRARDVNRNGLYEYLSQDEGGWDNSPRAAYVPRMAFISYYGMLGELIGSKVKPLDNADLNAWMYLYFRALGDWAEQMGKDSEAADWRRRAETLAGKVDEILWDEELGCWLDTYTWLGSKKPHHFRVLTPHVWFPAFAGATRDEAKARRAIEQHLLNPEEFFGRYPIPIVAYNDKYFDRTTPGWYSHIWWIGVYSALEALWRFGYEAEAAELRARMLAMMADQDGMKGIYETYDPVTGKYKNEWTTGGYASTQFGWSSAFTMEMILDRYQEERFVFADTRKIQGFIRRAENFGDRTRYYRVTAARCVPRVELWADAPLLSASVVHVRLSDPYGSAGAKTWAVQISGREFSLETDRDYELRIR